MNNRKIFLTLLILSVLSFEGMGQGKALDARSVLRLRTGVKEAARGTSTISCDFVQEKEMSMISEKIVSKGRFLLKKEKKLRWEYTEPFTYLIVIDNDRISIKDENKVSQFNMQSNKVFLEINRVILGSLQGTLLEDDKNFGASYFETGSNWIVKLAIKAPRLKESLDEIIIWFDRADYSVDRLDMREAGGDVTRITFSEKKMNQPIADEKFVVR